MNIEKKHPDQKPTCEAHFILVKSFALFNIYVLFLDKKYEKVRKVCDSRTLVGLARTQEVDDRFFNPFPTPDKYEVSYTYIVFIAVFSVCTSIVWDWEITASYI